MFQGGKRGFMKGTHLSLEDRKFIQRSLEEEKSKAQIGKELGKSPSSISKEVKLHRKLKPKRTYGRDIGYFCANKDQYGRCLNCKIACEHFEDRICKRRERIGVCNKCPKMYNCYLDRYFYQAATAHKEYLYTLSDSREGVNLTTPQMIVMAETIGPLLKRGQSVYQIIENHPELGICVKTLYTYIESGIFKDYGIDNFSLRRQVSMKKQKVLKPRKQPACYDGHKYEDFIEFRKMHPDTPATEMDTVYNDSEGPYIQTFIFENAPVMIGFLHEDKTSASMAGTLDLMQERLGEDYYKIFSLIVTDRGSEFEKVDLFEINQETGELRTNIFYCDPQQPAQKPHVENNHNYVRDIIPNGKNLKNLTQNDLDLMFSHINSTPRESLNGKTPYEVFAFFYGEELLKKLNVSKIDKDAVTLMPYLLNIK